MGRAPGAAGHGARGRSRSAIELGASVGLGGVSLIDRGFLPRAARAGGVLRAARGGSLPRAARAGPRRPPSLIGVDVLWRPGPSLIGVDVLWRPNPGAGGVAGRARPSEAAEGSRVSSPIRVSKRKKGRTQMRYTRLTEPLVRENGKLVPASWEEALDRAAAGFRAAVERHGPDTFGMFSC